MAQIKKCLWKARLFLAILYLGITSTRIRAEDFPIPTRVAAKVWFWELVFGRYPTSTVIIHDELYPELVVDLIDFKNLPLFASKWLYKTRKEREILIAKYLKRYQQALRHLTLSKKPPNEKNPMEWRIYQVYAKSPRHLGRLWAGEVQIRAQTGLKDEFARAAQRAKVFLPHMEAIFRAQGLPEDLTRLVFVESMFNTEAISKVGASGIWQFMPETARNFMIVNSYLDERNSPTKATRAAAKFLKLNLQELGHWPLAITAYNHGASSISKAVRTLGTHHIDEIIARYKAPSFGFASRNFYAEFLAARNTYNRSYQSPHPKDPKPLQFATINLKSSLNLQNLTQHTPLKMELLKKFNPCIRPKAFKSPRRVHLPAQYELIVPKALARDVERALNRIGRKGA